MALWMKVFVPCFTWLLVVDANTVVSSLFKALDCGFVGGALYNGPELSRTYFPGRTECLLDCAKQGECAAVNYHTGEQMAYILIMMMMIILMMMIIK